MPARWRSSALRLGAALALGVAILASVATSDTPGRKDPGEARPQLARGANQPTSTPAPASTAAVPATPEVTSRWPASTPALLRDQPEGSARPLPLIPPAPSTAAANSSHPPEGSESTLQPSDAEGYLPTEARLLEPVGRYAPVTTEVRVGFNMPIHNRPAVEQALQIEPAVSGGLDWIDGHTLRFRPERLAFGTTYRVRVAGFPGLPETAGRWNWTFTTIRTTTFTFDDCPTSPAAAQDLLAFMRQHHIRALTFPTGLCNRQYPWLVPALLADGHQVCNHTFSHPDLPKLSDPQISAEIAGGVHAGCNLLRPPYGDWDGPGGRVERAAAQQGYRLQFWDVDTLDWTGLGGQAIVSRIYDGGGGVVLMHFQGRHTLEALKLLDVPGLTGQG